MTGPLVPAEELRGLLGSVTVLDVRYRMGEPQGLAAFVEGHVPAAAYVDLDADLASPPGPGGRHPLPSRGRFEEAMQRAGVRDDRPVVAYDDWSGYAAARAWWLLRHYGHRAVRVLDGGWSAWVAAGGDVETGPTRPEPGDFAGGPGSMAVVDAADVLDIPVLVDARSPQRYRGDHEPVDPVAGHIPGAVNVPTALTLDNHGHLRDPRELREVFGRVGAVDGAGVEAYCGSGVTAAHTVLALASVGVEAALYPGSWSEWVADPGRPVATGADAG